MQLPYQNILISKEIRFIQTKPQAIEKKMV